MESWFGWIETISDETRLQTFVQIYIFEILKFGSSVIYKLYNGHCALFVLPVFAFYGAI